MVIGPEAKRFELEKPPCFLSLSINLGPDSPNSEQLAAQLRDFLGTGSVETVNGKAIFKAECSSCDFCLRTEALRTSGDLGRILRDYHQDGFCTDHLLRDAQRVLLTLGDR